MAPMSCNVIWHTNRIYVMPQYAYHQMLLWPLWLTNFLYRHSPTYAIFTYMKWNVRRKSNFAQFVTEYTLTYKGVQMISTLNHTGIWQASESQPHRLRYRQSVFLYHLCCTAFSFPHEKTSTFKKCYYFNYFYPFRTACLKLRNLKLRTKGSVYLNKLLDITYHKCVYVFR
jgi:hypothetical protein